MRSFKTIFAILTAFSLIYNIACEEDKPLTQEADLFLTTTESTHTPPTQTTASTKDLVTCPAAYAGYKFIEAFSLIDVSGPPSAADTATRAETTESPEPSQISLNKVSFVFISPNKITITDIVNNRSLECTFDANITSLTADDKLSSPIVVLGTDKGLKAALISELVRPDKILCEAFKSLQTAVYVKFTTAANSIDHTKEAIAETKEASGNTTAGLNVSINALPPGTKTTASNFVRNDYIYFTTKSNWIGRIKPSMLEGGCVEYISNIIPQTGTTVRPTSPSPNTGNIQIVDNNLLITLSDKEQMVFDLSTGSSKRELVQ